MPLGSAVASVFVEIGADSSGLVKGFGQAEAKLSESQQRLASMGQGMQQVGGQMTRYLTLPLVVAGAAALKFAVDFDTSMSRIQGLVGLSAGEVEAMRGSVLELAGETTRAPQELADALYFITSAGLRGQVALDALEVSAKAAAAGLGETQVVAGAITSAMNAYGHDVLGAAEATDILVATVRSGKVEAADLAPQIGRVADIASTLGITFAEVGGVMAYFTSTTGSAELAGTRLDGIMRKVVRPTQQFEEGLAGVGLSAEQFQTMVSEQGLVGALQSLQERFGGNAQAVANLFEESTAVAGVLGILNDRTGSLDGILSDVEGSTGALDNAFGAFAESAGFEASQSFAEIQVALIAVGDALAPLAADVFGFVAGFAGAFAQLPGPVLALVAAFAALLAAVGPILWIAGRTAQAWAIFGAVLPGVQSMVVAFARGMSTMMASFAAAHPYILAAVVALSALGVAMQMGGIGNASDAFESVSDSLMEAARAAGDAEAGLAAFMGQNIDPAFAAQLAEIGITIEDMVAAITGDQAGFDAFIARLSEADIDTNELELLRRLFPEIQAGMEGLDGVGAADALSGVATEADEAAQALEDLETAWSGLNNLMGDTEAAINARQALRDLKEEAMGALEGGVTAEETDSLTLSTMDYAASLQEVAESANTAADGTLNTRGAQRDLLASMRAVRDEIPASMIPMWDRMIDELARPARLNADGGPARRAIDDTASHGRKGWGSRRYTGLLDGNPAGALSAIDEVRRQAEKLASKTYTVTIDAQLSGDVGAFLRGPGGGPGPEMAAGRVDLSGYGSGQRAVWGVMAPSGPVDVTGPGTSGGSSGHGERTTEVTMYLNDEVVGRAAAKHLDRFGDR